MINLLLASHKPIAVTQTIILNFDNTTNHLTDSTGATWITGRVPWDVGGGIPSYSIVTAPSYDGAYSLCSNSDSIGAGYLFSTPTSIAMKAGGNISMYVMPELGAGTDVLIHLNGIQVTDIFVDPNTVGWAFCSYTVQTDGIYTIGICLGSNPDLQITGESFLDNITITTGY